MLVRRPVPPADVQRQTFPRQAAGHVLEEVAGEGQLFLGAPPLTQGAAHEGTAALARGAVDHLGKHRLVELHQGYAGGEQVVDLSSRSTRTMSVASASRWG